ncbi:MAG: SpoIID/LytB domain-containing protein [Clostridia bacterium]|nr:SpoIID/LytB domain-containing protein [Clostridia bacterium]
MKRFRSKGKVLAFVLAFALALACFTPLAVFAKGISIKALGGNDEFRRPTPPPTDYDFSTIRVLITIGSTSSIDVDLGTDYVLEGTNTTISGTMSSPVPVTISKTSSGKVKMTNRSTGAVIREASDIRLTRVDQNYELGMLKLVSCASDSTQGRMYLGNFRFFVKDSTLMMVNTVPMAYYIYGVVGYELNPYCEDEALRAQAIAAKAHGIYYIDSAPDSTYDIKDGYSSAQYQAYRGFRENRLPTMRHCLDVVGITIAYQDSFVPICYAHSNGGETSLPSFVFGSSCQWYDAAYGVAIDDIEFDEYTDDTDTINVTFGGTGDNSRFRDFILKKISSLYGVNATKLRSIIELYAFDPIEGTERHMQQLHVKAKVKTGDGDKTYTFECPTSHLRSFALTDVDGSGDDYSSYKYVFKKSRLIYWGKETSGGYTLIYSGHGHGVGLSQMGANIRANPATYAWTYQEILNFYYPNFDIITITERNPDGTLPSPPDDPFVVGPDAVAYGICTADGTNFRSGPGTEYSIIATVNKDEHFDIFDVSSNGWFKAWYKGLNGYISLDLSYVTGFPSPADGVFTLMDGTTNGSVNLRSEPYIRDGNVITRLPNKTKVTAWAHINKWYYVTTDNGYEGFLSNLTTTYGDPYEYTGVASISPRSPESYNPFIYMHMVLTPFPQPEPTDPRIRFPGKRGTGECDSDS